MKNLDFVTLANAGVLESTQHTLSTAHSYKVFQLKSVIRKTISTISQTEKELLAECGIGDDTAFMLRRNELLAKAEDQLTEEERKELKSSTDQLTRYTQMRSELMDEEAPESTRIRTIPYDEWVKLQDENRSVMHDGVTTDVFSSEVEELLYGNFWLAPEESE